MDPNGITQGPPKKTSQTPVCFQKEAKTCKTPDQIIVISRKKSMNLQFHPNPSPSKFGKRVSVLIGKDISLRKAHHPSTFPAGKKTRSFQPRFPWLVHPQKSRRHAGDFTLKQA